MIVVVLALVTAGVAGTGAAMASAGASGATAQESAATVTFQNQTSGGQTVTVRSVTMPEGGFVTIHDASLNDGETLASVVGSSAYLPEGTHENVTVQLDESMSNDTTLVAMPHKDTDGDRIYEFVPSQGESDGPYTKDGDIVLQSADVTVAATVALSDQPSDGGSVLVDSVTLSEDGFVTIHDETLLDGQTFESVRGATYLPAGTHENVRVPLEEPLEEGQTAIAMPHTDTNDNQEYDFVTSDGEEDGPFLNHEGDIVLDPGQVTLPESATVSYANQTTGGHSVTVDSVFLPEGGFVTAHDSSLTEGKTFESVRGTSAYLGPGFHRNVTVHLNESLAESDTLYAMPHTDTNDNQEYDFVTSDGENDGPYTKDGDVVHDDGETTVAAWVTVDDQASDGNTIVVETVDLSEDGFVTIHDASLSAGETFGSVRGTSKYLEAGHHHNVTVTFEDPLTASATVVAMPHTDTNDNQEYDFVTGDGENDGPVTSGGGIVVDTARASVTAQTKIIDQTSDGSTVTVGSVTLHNGGFVTIHDGTLLDGETFGSVRGSSKYLAPGTHENVTVQLDDPYEQDGTVIAMPHHDTDGDESYDFVTSDGADDGPYVAGGDIVLASAKLGFARSDGSNGSTATAEGTEMIGTATDDDGSGRAGELTTESAETTQTGQPGFSVAVAVLALLVAALVTVRRH